MPNLYEPLVMASDAEVLAGVNRKHILTPAQARVFSTIAHTTPVSVANNTAKLALTGIAIGQIVKITGEANRIEQYLGGTISSDASWVVIGRNTYQLRVQDPSHPRSVTINGVTLTTGASPDTFGWVAEGSSVACTQTVAYWKNAGGSDFDAMPGMDDGFPVPGTGGSSFLAPLSPLRGSIVLVLAA